MFDLTDQRRRRLTLALIGLILTAGALFTLWTVRDTDRQMRLEHLRRARLVAEALDLRRLQELSGTEADLTSPDYQRLKEQLAATRTLIKGCRFLYLMRRSEDGVVFFLVDSEPIGSEDESLPGETYDETTPELLRAFDEKSDLVEGPTTDRWGIWISALVPLTDPVTGRLNSVLGMDIEAGAWRWMLVQASFVPALLTLILVAIVLGGNSLLAWRDRAEMSRSRWLGFLEAALTVAVGLTLTAAVVWQVHRNEIRNRSEVFSQLGSTKTAHLHDALRDVQNIELEGLARFFESSDYVDPREFVDYVGHLTRNTAVQAWVWAPAVYERDRERFEREARESISEDFSIWEYGSERNRTAVSGRDVYYPVLYVAPFAGNESGLGFDIGSEPVRFRALQEAMQTRLMTGSDPITLVPDSDNPRGALICRPVYWKDDPDRLQGFALAALRFSTLLRVGVGSEPGEWGRSSVVVDLVQLRSNQPSQSLTSTTPGSRKLTWDRFCLIRPVFAFGKTYAVVARPDSSFFVQPARLGWIVALSGLVMALAMGLVVGMLAHRREQLEYLVVERTAALMERDARLRGIAESAQDAIIMMDPKGDISYWNPAAETIFGFTAEEAIGRDLHELLAPERYRADFRKAFVAFAATGLGNVAGKTTELVALCRDGKEIPVELSLSAVSLNGEWHAVGIMRDITARKRAEEDLQAINRQLEDAIARANEMAVQAELASIAKSEFLANMSHEIRTPMNGVIGMTGLLLDTDLSDEQRRYAETVRTCGESLLMLINDILDFSKIEAGKMDLEILDFDLQHLLDDLTATIALKAHEKGLELLCSAEPDVPSLLRGDPGRLRQILLNLVGNALKFTHAGEVAIRVRQESISDTDVVLRFSVRDTGIGIPQDKTEAIFSKFAQVDASTTRRYGGTGLGLAISKQLAEMMGGTIGVESRIGEGSEFWFTARFAKQVHTSPPKEFVPADLHGVRVVVVDDNETSRQILLSRLSAWGMRASDVPDGKSALNALREAVDESDPFQVAVIDMQMPEMDGEALGIAIHADDRLMKTRMVMLTSLGARGDARRLEEIGFSAYLPKPMRHRELKAVLVALLSPSALADCTPGDGAESRSRPIVTRHSAVDLLGSQLDADSPEAGSFSVKGVRILLVEDNVVNQQVALGILKKFGLRADAVANGSEALKALESMPYHLVFMDVQMPVMDGLEATRCIRKTSFPLHADSPRPIPIIAMTAHAMASDRTNCLQAGMDDYVSKPITGESLAKVLERWLPRVAVAVPESSEQDAVEQLASKPNDASIFDRAGLLHRLMDDEDLAATIIESFLDDIPRQIHLLRDYVKAGDWQLAELQAHTIKGASANVGGETLRAVAFQMESAARTGDVEAVVRLMPDLERTWLQLKKVIVQSR